MIEKVRMRSKWIFYRTDEFHLAFMSPNLDMDMNLLLFLFLVTVYVRAIYVPAMG